MGANFRLVGGDEDAAVCEDDENDATAADDGDAAAGGDAYDAFDHSSEEEVGYSCIPSYLSGENK